MVLCDARNIIDGAGGGGVAAGCTGWAGGAAATRFLQPAKAATVINNIIKRM